MKIKKYLPILFSTVCFYGAVAVPTLPIDATFSASAATISQNQVNGFNVKQVVYGPKQGFFQQQADGTWIEKNSDGQFTFKETGRDEWSVYLLKSDGLEIQLDLHRQEVIWRGQGKLYEIKNAFNTVVVNGLNVKQVQYGGKKGFFQQQADGTWMEKNSDGKFTFRELGRDEWSVYLLKSDGLRIQLDLHRKEVIWMGKGKLYSITSSSSNVSTPAINTSKPAQAIQAGPIWNQNHANQKCPQIALQNNGTWTGHWWTTIPGQMSVCQIK